jgi:hypothetical protein
MLTFFKRIALTLLFCHFISFDSISHSSTLSNDPCGGLAETEKLDIYLAARDGIQKIVERYLRKIDNISSVDKKVKIILDLKTKTEEIANQSKRDCATWYKIDQANKYAADLSPVFELLDHSRLGEFCEQYSKEPVNYITSYIKDYDPDVPVPSQEQSRKIVNSVCSQMSKQRH